MTAYTNLGVHMKLNLAFKVMPHMSWSLDEIESRTPYEREAYLAMCNQFVERVNEKRKEGQ